MIRTSKKPNFNKRVIILLFLVQCLMISSLIRYSFGSSNHSLRTSSISILIYTQYADINNELQNTKDSITAGYGAFVSEDLLDYNNLATELQGHKIFLIPEQEFGNPPLFQTIGENWKDILYNFTYNGGIVILLDGSGDSFHIFNSSELMLIEGCVSNLDGNMLEVTALDDPLASHVYSTFNAPSATKSFITSEVISVVEYNSNPVVIHKEIGNGHLILLGFDFFEVNADINIILGNAISLGDNNSSDVIPGYEIFFIIGISIISVGILILRKKLLHINSN
ncbi:MAG: hypothetical protein KGD63_04105 [Candidatus Lokiarchaeota archaeon]|nr:hypothetical protein [Candidatus Lokiarchaeota archaeon]